MAANNSLILILFSLLVLASNTEGRPTDNTFDYVLNRTEEAFFTVYDTVANDTKNFVNNISDDITNIMESCNETASNSDKAKNCSIVLGGALAGAGIGLLCVGVAIPLVLCILGFTCWGIMAGSAAACCQSNIGDVPADSCFSCLQSLGAGGGMVTYILISCFVGIPIGFYLGGYYTDTYFHCFSAC